MRAAHTSTIGGPSGTLGIGETIRPEPTLSVRCTTASTASVASVGVKRALDTGDAGHLTTQEALVEAYEGSKAENRLGFLRSLCSAEFRRLFYGKPSEYNRISETQKALFKAKIAELRIGDEQESASIVRCLTALVDSLRLVPFSEFCTALAHCTVEMCTKAREAVQAGSVQKVKLLVAVSNIGVPDKLDSDPTKKSNEWIPLLLFAMLIAGLEPDSKVHEFMAERYPEALRVLRRASSTRSPTLCRFTRAFCSGRWTERRTCCPTRRTRRC
jgi:hypothetical protein